MCHFKRPTPMKTQLIFSTFFLTIFFTSCGQTINENRSQAKQDKIIKIDTTKITILPFDTTQYLIFKNNKPADLTKVDLQKIEKILTNWINEYNPVQEKQFIDINKRHPEYKLDKKNFIIDLTLYKRQYVATINSRGEKEIWVNCFCTTHNKNWKTERIIIKDGGNCYFSLKVNLTTGKYYELLVNGDA